MAGVQATIDLVVRGSSAVNRLIQDVSQLQGAVDRINSRTLDVGAEGIGKTIGDITKQLKDARGLDRLANAQERLNTALNKAKIAEEQLAERAEKRLDSNAKVHKNIQNNLNESRVAAAAAEKEIERLRNSLEELLKQPLSARQLKLQAAVPKLGELININQVAGAQKAIKALAEEFNKLGDSVQRDSEELRISGTDLPKQINQFNQLARRVQEASDAIDGLKQRRRQLGESEKLREMPTALNLGRGPVDVRSVVADYAKAEREATERLEREREIQVENKKIQARNKQRAAIDAEIAARETELNALSSQARQAGELAVGTQARLADLMATRQNVGLPGATGLNISLNQIQAQAEALALVANNSSLASNEFRKFTVATELASIKLAKSQQETFSTLAGALSSAMPLPEGLRDTSGQGFAAAGARRSVKDLIDYIPNLTRSQAALSSYLGLLRQVQTLLPFTSSEFRQLEEAVAGLEQELEGATAQGKSRQNRAAAIREEQRRNIETRRNELQRRADVLGTGGLAAVQLGRITPEMTAERPYEATGILNQVQRRLKIQEQISQNAQREAEERRSATKALQTQLTTLKSLSIDLQNVQQTGVQIERERAGLGELINSIEEGRYNNSKLSVSIVGEEIKKYRALLGLRSKEAAMPAPSGPTERIGDLAARRRYKQELERQFSISAKIATQVGFPVEKERLLLALESASNDLMSNRLESARQITDEIEKQLKIRAATPAPSGPAERVGDLGAQLKYVREVADLYEKQFSISAKIATQVGSSVERESLLSRLSSASNDLLNNRLETSKRITDEIEEQLQLTVKQESATAKNQRQIDILREGMLNLQQFYRTAAAGGADVSAGLTALKASTANFINSPVEPTQENVDAMREVLRQSTSALELAKSRNTEERITAKNTQRLANLQGELASASERAMQFAQRLQSIMAGTTGDPAIEAQINAAQQIATENEAFLRDRKAGLSVEAEYEAMAKKQATAVGSIRSQYRKLLTIQAEYRKAENKGATFSEPEKEALQAVVENVRISAEAGISTPARQSIVGGIIKTFGEILRLRKAEASSMDEAAKNERTFASLARDGAKLLSLYNKAQAEGLSIAKEKSALEGLLNEMRGSSLPITKERLNYLKAELDCAADILQIEKTNQGIEGESVKTRQKLLAQQRELLLLQSLYNKSEAQGVKFSDEQKKGLTDVTEEVNRLIQTQPEAAKPLAAAIDAKIKKIEDTLRLGVANLDEAAAKFRAEEGKAGVTTKSSKLESAIAASEISAETRTQLETKRQAAFGRLAEIGPTATLGLLSSIEKEFNAEVRLANQRKKDASEETQNKSKLNTLLRRGKALQAALNAASAAGLDVSKAKAELQAEINKLNDPNTKNTKENVSLARDQLTNAITALRVAREQADKIRDQNKEQEKLNIQIERRAKLEKTIKELEDIKEPGDFLTKIIQDLKGLNEQAKKMIEPLVKEEGQPLKPSASGAKSALDEANKLLQLKKEQEERQAKLNNLVKRGDSIIQAFNTAKESGLEVDTQKNLLQDALNKAKSHEATLNKGSVQETRDAISAAISELRIAKEKNNQGKIQSKIAKEIAEYEAKRKQLKEDVDASRLEEATRNTIIQAATPIGSASQEEKTKALRAAEELLKSETKSLEIQEKGGTQRLALQNLLNRYNELERQGVKFLEEKLELSDAISLTNAKDFKFTQANVNAFDLLLQRGTQYARLRKAQSMEAGTFIPGGKKATTPKNLEARRERLLKVAMSGASQLIDLEMKGVSVANERREIEQAISDIQGIRNKASQEELVTLAQKVQAVRSFASAMALDLKAGAIPGVGLQAALQQLKEAREARQEFLGAISPAEGIDKIVREFNTGKAGGTASDATGVGENAASSYTSGIRTGIPAAAKAMMDLGKAGIGALKKALRMASPSRVMLEIAKNQIDTYVNFLKAAIPAVEAAAKAVGEAGAPKATGVPESAIRRRMTEEARTRPLDSHDLYMNRFIAEAAAMSIAGVPSDRAELITQRIEDFIAKTRTSADLDKLFSGLEDERFEWGFYKAGMGISPGPEFDKIRAAIADFYQIPAELTPDLERGVKAAGDASVSADELTRYVSEVITGIEQIGTLLQSAAKPFASSAATPADVIREDFGQAQESAAKNIASEIEETIRKAAEIDRANAEKAKKAAEIRAKFEPSIQRAAELDEEARKKAIRESFAASAAQADADATAAANFMARAIEDPIADAVPEGKNKIQAAVEKLFDRISSMLRGIGGGGGGGPRPPAGGGGAGGDFYNDPGDLTRRATEAAQQGPGALLSLKELVEPARVSTKELEALSTILKEFRSVLDPTVEGFDRLDNQLRKTAANLDEITASRAPDADFLTRITKSPRMANAISEGLIGGMFPLLFGQGIGSALFGGLGGGLGGFAGGGLGFGLSLFGTAIGGMFDALNQAAQETGKSLNYPIEGFDKLKEANLFASREQEYYISKLIESGQTTKATAEIQAQMIEKIGVNGVNDLMKLGDASSELSKVWAEFTLQLQAALAGPMAGLLKWASDMLAAFNRFSGSRQYAADIKDSLAGKERQAFVKELQKIELAVVLGSGVFPVPGGISQEEAARQRISLADRYRQFAKPVVPGVREGKKDPKAEEEAINAQRQVADEIKSAYREGFQLQQKIIDAERKGAEIRRRLANEIIEKQQELDRRQIEAMQKRAQISIETLDLEYQRRISAQEGRSAEILAAEAEFLKTRLQGEAETAAKRKTLEIDVSRLRRAAEEYIYNLNKEADSIRRDTLSLEMDVLDYRLSIERKIEDARRSNKRGESQMTGYEDGKIPSAAQIGAKNLTPRERALLATIRWAETGTSGPESYRKLFGGGMFTDLSRHPDRVVRASGYASAAAGAYQFMPETWKMAGGGSMAPERQDAAALWLALRHGANINKMGFTQELAAKIAPQWASFPTMSGRSYYGQPVKSFKELERYYNTQLKAAQTRGSDWNAGMSGGNWPAGVPKPKALQTAEAAGGMGGQRMAAERPSFPGGFLGTELQLGAALSQVGTSIRRRLGEGIQVGAIAGQRAQLLTQEIGLEQELVALEEKISKLQDQKSFQKLTDVITGKKEIEQRVRANELARAELAALAPMSQEKQEALFLEIRGKKEIADLEEENLNYIKSVLANNKYTKKEQDALINAAAANVAYAKERNRLDAENLQIAQKRRFAEEMISLRQDLRRKNLSVEAGFFGAAASAYADELRVSGDVGQAIDKARLTRAKEIAETVINAKEELMSLMDVNNLKAGAAGAISGAVGEGFKGTLGVLTSMDTFAERSGINAQIKQLEKLRAGLKETDPEYVELSKKIGEARGKLAELGDTGLKVQKMLADMFQNIANHFLDMASQMIAKWVQLELMNRLLPLFSRPTAPSSGSSDLAASFLSAAFQLPGYMNAAPDIASGFLTTAFQMPSYMSGASIPTPFAKGGAFSNSIVSSPTLFRYADGGTFATGYMGEAGPEAVMPLTRGPGGRLGVDATNAGGGDINVVVNVDASGSNVQGDDRQAGQLGQAIATAVRQELISQKRPGGLLA